MPFVRERKRKKKRNDKGGGGKMKRKEKVYKMILTSTLIKYLYFMK